MKTLQLYAGVFFFRCCSILVYDGYLPFDRSGDWLYQVVEAGSMILAIATIVLCMSRFRSTYDRSYDIFGTFAGMPTELGALWLFLPCLLVAMVRTPPGLLATHCIGLTPPPQLVHPSLNQNFFTDTAWTLAMYLEVRGPRLPSLRPPVLTLLHVYLPRASPCCPSWSSSSARAARSSPSPPTLSSASASDASSPSSSGSPPTTSSTTATSRPRSPGECPLCPAP